MAEQKGKSAQAGGFVPAGSRTGGPRNPYEALKYPSIHPTSPLFADFDVERALKAGRREVARYEAAGIPREALSYNAEWNLGLLQEMLFLDKQGKLSPAHQDEVREMIRNGVEQSLPQEFYDKAVKAGLPAYLGRPSEALRAKAYEAEELKPGAAVTEAASPIHRAARLEEEAMRRPVTDARRDLDRKVPSGYDMLRGL